MPRDPGTECLPSADSQTPRRRHSCSPAAWTSANPSRALNTYLLASFANRFPSSFGCVWAAVLAEGTQRWPGRSCPRSERETGVRQPSAVCVTGREGHSGGMSLQGSACIPDPSLRPPLTPAQGASSRPFRRGCFCEGSRRWFLDLVSECGLSPPPTSVWAGRRGGHRAPWTVGRWGVAGRPRLPPPKVLGNYELK